MLAGAKFEILLGDCLSVLKSIESGSASLVYLDPPFFTQKNHKLMDRSREKEYIFNDVWSSDETYFLFLCERLSEIKRVLSETGSIVFHCDRNGGHLARFALDKVFGKDNFRSEIIWQYRRWSNSKMGLLQSHQTLLYYTKTNNFTFNPVYVEYSASTNVDQILQKRTRDAYGKCVYEKNESGSVVSSGGKVGVPLSDVWDIPYLNPKAKERTGYPTQKPLTLLERLVELMTMPGDLVIDPFCGSGTTLVAAVRLKRRALGIDISQDAIELSRKRLANPIKTESNLIMAGRESYRTADESALVHLQGIPHIPVHRNKGIDAILQEDIYGSPIPVRVQRKEETVIEAALSLFKASQGKNAKIMFLVVAFGNNALDIQIGVPPGVVVIDSPAVNMLNYIKQYKNHKKQLIGG